MYRCCEHGINDSHDALSIQVYVSNRRWTHVGAVSRKIWKPIPCPHEMEANCVNLFGDISIKNKYIYIFQVMFQRRVQNNEVFFPPGWSEL